VQTKSKTLNLNKSKDKKTKFEKQFNIEKPKAEDPEKDNYEFY